MEFDTSSCYNIFIWCEFDCIEPKKCRTPLAVGLYRHILVYVTELLSAYIFEKIIKVRHFAFLGILRIFQ